MKSLPYILALLRNVTVKEQDGSGWSQRPRIMWAVLRNDKRTIDIRSRDYDGTPVSLGLTSLKNPEIEKMRTNIDWIRTQPGLVDKLKRFCREKGYCSG